MTSSSTTANNAAANADSAQDAGADTQDVLRSLGAEADEQIADLRHRLRATFSDVRDRLAQFQVEATGASKRVAANVDGYVRERPWTALAAGLLIGVLAGALLTRRRDSSS
jgi:ElaB/YqjD/DUF883 family membrane-anchored ribosome-binding protein